MDRIDIFSVCISEMAMRKTTVQIDEALLAEAIEAIGAFSFSSSQKKPPEPSFKGSGDNGRNRIKKCKTLYTPKRGCQGPTGA